MVQEGVLQVKDGEKWDTNVDILQGMASFPFSMNMALQKFLLGAYGAVMRTGFLETRFGRGLFEFSYHVYKNALEAGPVDLLRPHVRPGSTVIDVGANVGFFTLRFARWAGSEGRVLAIEPEATNCHSLHRALARADLARRVEVIQAVAAESAGVRMLEINPFHPADHKIGASGVEVPAVTLDEIIEARGNPWVSLIKIDVQGGESAVLVGAERTLARCRPALFVEVDDGNLRRQGSSAASLLSGLAAYGYEFHCLHRGGIGAPIPLNEAGAMVEASGYRDFLMLIRDGE